MSRKNIEDIYPLSPLQQGILFHALYSREVGLYLEQFPFVMEGGIDLDAAERAWRKVVARHPVLRTGFVWENVPNPLQVVFREAELTSTRLDWSGMEEEEWRVRLADHLAADRRNAFDLKKAPLLRLTLAKLGETRCIFVLTFHHVLLDGWSVPLVFGDWADLYRAETTADVVELPPVPRYRDYIGWLGKQSPAAAETFWRGLLKGFTAPTPIPLDTGVPGTVAEEHAVEKMILDREFLARLDAFAREHSLTVNTVVQGAWGLVLSRFSGEDDVVFGTTTSGRPADLRDVERMVGLFINTVPARVQIDPTQKVREWLTALQRRQADIRQHDYARLVDVQGWSEVPRDTQLFESLLVYENYPLRTGGADGAGGDAGGDVDVRMAPVEMPERTNYALTVVVAPGARLIVRITYDSKRYARETIRRIQAALAQALAEIIGDPDRRVGDVPLATEDDLALYAAWNDVPAPSHDPSLTITRLFEAQADRTPDAPAIVHQGRTVTYAELEARANRIAHRLRTLGVGPETTVGVCMARTPDVVAAIYGVLKAGGAYVPLDPAYPADRLGFMLQDAGARVLLTERALAGRVHADGAAVVLADDGSIDAEPSDRPGVPADPSSLAYVIYTSGSTGRPKGVAIQHASAVTFLHWMHATFPLAAGERVLASSSVSFDVHVAELHFSLAWGHTALLVENALSALELTDADAVAMASMVPTAGAELVRAGKVPSTLRVLNLGGEAIPAALVDDLFAGTSLEVVGNGYGPTEDTTYSTYAQIRRGERVTLGRPVAGTVGRVLDARLHPVPAGGPGEMYLSGAGVTRGYFARPVLTAERYLPDPFSAEPGARMYRTGDLVRLTPSGEMEYLGRTDFQVKIRGFRIELGEIEEVLCAHPAVAAAAVTAPADAAGGRRLVAYYLAERDATANAAELRAHLAAALPEWMVPAAWVEVEAFPRTDSGKIDRRALPTPEPVAAAEYVAPRTPTEEALAEIWKELLKVERVGSNDSFFELGGHSLLATRLSSAIRDKLEVEVPLRELFEAALLSEQAARIDALKDAELAALLAEMEGMSDEEARALLEAEA